MTEQTSHTTARPPIVAVLGHVDHGKSTLLDYIRKSNTVEGEAGGITQHVAAYEVEHEHEGSKKRITFIDTPGHAAFKAIRARGANIADIAILVVAADDGVKAQTLEALESIKASGTPFIVAINKIDKNNADVERTKTTLLENGIYLEGLGGDISYAPISAKTGEGIPDLLDLVLLAAELEEFAGDTSAPASGYVIEAHQDQKRGIAATLIITNGALRSGEAICARDSVAPLRIMEDFAGSPLKEASFSTPIVVYGFNTLPKAGASFTTHATKKEAEAACKGAAQKQSKASEIPEEDTVRLPLIVKADVAGSLEAVEAQLEELQNKGMLFSVISSGIGSVSENDLQTAATAKGSVVLGFNVGIDAAAQEIARQQETKVEFFSIIYELAERVETLANEYQPKTDTEEVLGKAQVKKIFSQSKSSQTIGGAVTLGEIRKKALVRILRKNEEVGVGEVMSLQTAKQSVDRVGVDSEFGGVIELPEAIQSGDVLECFIVHKAGV